MIIGVDFDGTCVTHEFPKVGREIGAAQVLKRLTDVGHQIILFTMRSQKRAGTADKILLNTETGNLVIQDWKTNSTNILQVYNNKKLKEPFDKLPCNALNKYAIQLSTYQKMIENNTDLKVEALWITWLKQGDYTILDEGKDEKKYKIIKTQADIDHALFKQFNVNSLADKID